MQIHPFTFTHGWGENFSPKLTRRVNLGESVFLDILGEVRWGENFSPKFTYRWKRVKADFHKILGEVRWGETFTQRSPMRLLALKLALN